MQHIQDRGTDETPPGGHQETPGFRFRPMAFGVSHQPYPYLEPSQSTLEHGAA